MHIKLGDLVQRRNPTEANSLGIVIDKRIANEGANKSEHMKHIVETCMRVCYVFFIDEGVSGPFHESDLVVKQSGDYASFNID